MRSSGLLALFAATAILAAAQQTATVTGTVTNSVTGAPIVRAHVTLSGAQNFGALTDDQGKFTIDGIPPAGYQYAAERVGFTSERHFGVLSVDFQSGANRLDLRLVPMAAISGTILDAAGEPVQSITVVAVGSNNDFSVTTDFRGHYRIGSLVPGKYRVQARPQNQREEIRTDGSKQVHYRATYYPAVASAKEAARVAVTAGSDVTGVDITLLTTPFVRIGGKVRDVPPGRVVWVYAGFNTTANSSTSISGAVATDGTFVIQGLDPGDYSVHAAFNDSGTLFESAPIDVHVGTTNIANLELPIVAPFRLSGHIEFEDDHAREASQEARYANIRDRVVQLIPAGRAEIGPDNSFTIEGVTPGRYSVIVQLGDTFVKSVTLGTVQSERTIDVRNGGGGAQLTILVSANWNSISGTVSDSQGPLHGGFVELHYSDRGSNEATVDLAGHFAFPHVYPGTYRLIAGDERVRFRSTNPDLLDDYKDFVVTVTVHAGDKITQELKPIPPDK
jgi:hypothetical protein